MGLTKTRNAKPRRHGVAPPTAGMPSVVVVRGTALPRGLHETQAAYCCVIACATSCPTCELTEQWRRHHESAPRRDDVDDSPTRC